MNVDKAFIKALKHHYNGEDVFMVGYYEDIKVLFERLVALKDTYIKNVELHDPQWKGYVEPFTLSLDSDGQIWCEESIFDNGNVGACFGYVLIDEYIDQPERFVIDGTSYKKV